MSAFENAELILPDIPHTKLHEVIEEFLRVVLLRKENS